MQLTAKEISEIVRGTLSAREDIIITGAAGIDEAGPRDVSFVANPKYESHIPHSNAGVLLVPETTEEMARPVIRVKNPQLAFAQLLSLVEKERLKDVRSGVHSTAVVSVSARIGAGVTIGPYVVIEDNATIADRSRLQAHCFIGANASIGSDCLIYSHVTIREDISIGNRVIIHPGTVIGSDGFGFVPGVKGHFKIPQLGGVEIGDDVEIGANVAIDRATTGQTRIGSGTKIDNLVHIAHNVQIGKHCLITGQVGFAGSSKIGDFVTFAAQSGAAGHISIGDGAIIAARAGVIKDVPAKEVVSGFPARPHREELKVQALIHKLPELFKDVKDIKNSLK